MKRTKTKSIRFCLMNVICHVAIFLIIFYYNSEIQIMKPPLPLIGG